MQYIYMFSVIKSYKIRPFSKRRAKQANKQPAQGTSCMLGATKTFSRRGECRIRFYFLQVGSKNLKLLQRLHSHDRINHLALCRHNPL